MHGSDGPFFVAFGLLAVLLVGLVGVGVWRAVVEARGEGRERGGGDGSVGAPVGGPKPLPGFGLPPGGLAARREREEVE